jgi:hypothetical protein
VEVDVNKEPAEGEVLVFTVSGGFLVKATMPEATKRFAAEEWPLFELAESNDKIIIRSSQVVALREGSRSKQRGAIGFVHGH